MENKSQIKTFFLQNELLFSFESKGFIIVESNYRVYAYTESLLKITILRLFTQPISLLSNLYVGTISKKSCLRAFESGVSADKILFFLWQYAHPKALIRNTRILPEIVKNQIF